jgi:hypothetical protein
MPFLCLRSILFLFSLVSSVVTAVALGSPASEAAMAKAALSWLWALDGVELAVFLAQDFTNPGRP